MKHQNYLATLVVLSALSFSAQDAMAYKQENQSVRVNGKVRQMVVFTPDDVNENLPLMIVTHGMNQSPEYQYDADKMYLMVDEHQFIVAYLRSEGTMWDTSGTKDQNFVTQSIAALHETYGIDPHRVYWSGFSMGSMLMYHCMDKMQGKIAAFAPTSGVQFTEQPWNQCKRPVNLIHCHAYADDVFGYESYGIHDYVENMAKMNKYTEYEKIEGYNPGGWFDGDKEVWTNELGNKVELFSYNNGGHWPQQANGYEIWNFCKEYSIADENLDPLAELEAPADYTADTDSELLGDADKLNGKVLLPTDVNIESIWYVNNTLDSPQNVRSGSMGDISENPMCWLKFTKVDVPTVSVEGTLYTIQFADQNGATYSLWGSNGYLNTPVGEWCLFALGLGDIYGQDAENYGLWSVDYAEEGFTLMNVGSSMAGGNSWASPAYETPQADKVFLRLFSKLKKQESSIDQVVTPRAESRAFDLMGREVAAPRQGMIFIRDGQKFIVR